MTPAARRSCSENLADQSAGRDAFAQCRGSMNGDGWTRVPNLLVEIAILPVCGYATSLVFTHRTSSRSSSRSWSRSARGRDAERREIVWSLSSFSSRCWTRKYIASSVQIGSTLFLPQSDHRIHIGSPACRQVAGQECRCGNDGGGSQINHRFAGADTKKECPQSASRKQRAHQSNS